jgi:hypothetical protein
MEKKYKPDDFMGKNKLELILIAIANELSDIRQDLWELKEKLIVR